MPEAALLRVYSLAGLFIGIAAVSAGLHDAREGRMLRRCWPRSSPPWRCCSRIGAGRHGEGGRVLYALAAIAALTVALPLRSSDGGLRAAAWVIALVLLGSALMLTRGMVERRAQAGAEVNALIAALAQTADAMPASSYAFVIVPDRIGSIPFARNAQGGLMSPPVQPRSLSPLLVVQLAEELPRWPTMLENNIIGRLKSEPLEDVTANPQAPGTTQPLTVPDHYFCWSLKRHRLEPLPLQFEPGFRDWNEVWARGLAARVATHDRAQRSRAASRAA